MVDKPTLLLVPGVICDQRLWQAVRPGLEAVADVQVTSAHYRHGSFDDIVDAVLAEAPDRFAIAGLSFGGYIAMEVAHRAPKRVERMALLNTSGRADTPERRAERQRMSEQARIGRFIGVTKRLAAQFVHPDRAEEAELIGIIQAMAATVGRDGYILQQTAILERPDARAFLPDIACPTLVVAGRQDQRTPVELHEEIAGLIPGARLTIIEDCGHLSPLERPDEVLSAMLDWFKGDTA